MTSAAPEIRRHRFTPTDPRCGRHVEHDERSRAFAVGAKATKLKTTFWSTQAPGLDQGEIGSCTGNAPTQLINTDLWTPIRTKILGKGKFGDETYALKIYHQNTVLDGFPGTYPPDDTGSSGLAAAKTLKKFKLASAYHHAFAFSSLLRGLQTNPCIVGTVWTESMFDTDKNFYVKPTGKEAGGHEYFCLGVDMEKDELWFRQSWGDGWGTETDFCPSQAFRIRFADFQKLLANQGDATFPVPIAA
jgi:hypothetical protein